MRIVRLLIPFVAAGCLPGQPIDTDTSPPTCDITFSDATPADGATGFYYRSVLSWEFSERDDSVTVSLMDASGAAIPGAGEWLDEVFVWTPDDDLTPSAAYTWTVTHCDGAASRSGSFATSDVGSPVDPGDIDGALFVLDLSSGTWVQPPGFGALLQSQIDAEVLVGFTVSQGASPELSAAFTEEASNPPMQDLCRPSVALGSADLTDNPAFEMGPEAIAVMAGDLEIEVEVVLASGSFEPDGEGIQGLAIHSLLDTRVLGLTGAPGQVCASATNIPCVPCADGAVQCVDVLVTDLLADRLPGQSLIPRDTATIAADPSCP